MWEWMRDLLERRRRRREPRPSSGGGSDFRRCARLSIPEGSRDDQLAALQRQLGSGPDAASDLLGVIEQHERRGNGA